jgi:predicted nucleic acid-binding protein
MTKLKRNSNKARTRKRKNKAKVQAYRSLVKQIHFSSWYYNQPGLRRKELDEKLNAFLKAFKTTGDYKKIQKLLIDFIEALNLFEKELSFDLDDIGGIIIQDKENIVLNMAEID